MWSLKRSTRRCVDGSRQRAGIQKRTPPEPHPTNKNALASLTERARAILCCGFCNAVHLNVDTAGLPRTCCQVRCQPADFRGAFTYETGGEGNRTPVSARRIALHRG
jgi:hypothetical protein